MTGSSLAEKTYLRALTAVAFALLILATSVFAQAPTGTILGVVKDSSGASIPRANVTVQSTESGLTRSTVTGDDGSFRVPALPVGAYSVKVESTGFKTETQTGLTLDVAQEAVVNFTLQVGTTEQQVVVTTEAPQINTTSGAIGQLVDQQQIAELPLNGRNFSDLTLLQTGVTRYTNYSASNGNAGLWFSSNGAPVRSNMFTLDGAIMGNVDGASVSSVTGQALGVDAIREYRVMTNDFSAEYGLRMGSQTVIVTKSGTNQFHGDGFEYLRNSALDARQHFDDLYELPTTVPGGGRRVAPFRRNQFGGALGGPIKKDKTFFFTTYEGFRQVLDNPTYVAIATVPPAACHFYGTATGVTTTPLSAANNTVNNQACVGPLGTSAGSATGTTTVDPSFAQYVMPLFPLPNLTLNGFPSFDYLSTETTRDDYGQTRIDHTLSSTDTLFGRYTIDDSAQIRPASVPGYLQPWTQRSQYITLSESHIFSPALLNSASFSFSRGNVVEARQNPGYTGPTCLAGDSVVCGLGGTPVTSVEIGPGGEPILQIQNVFSWSDDLIWTKGKHALKFGALINYWQQGVQNTAKAAGLINFRSFQTFLQGNYASVQIPVQGSNFARYTRFDTLGFYVQDDYRVLPRLTLNLGLRLEYLTTPTENKGQAYVTNILTQTTFLPGPRQATPPPAVSPRFGFAWDIFGNGKTSLRGGAALLYDVGGIGQVYYATAGGSPPFSLYATTDTSPFTLPEPIPAAPANPYSPQGFRFDEPAYYYSTPRVVDYNLSVERQLPGDVALSVAYAGSRGMDLWQWGEGNPRCPTQNPYVPVGCTGITTSTGPTEWLNGSASAARENNYFNSINLMHTDGDSWYNSLQVNLTKRVGQGLSFQSSYTYSKLLDDNQGQLSQDASSATGAYILNPFDELEDKGPAAFDVRQNWRFNMLYHVPELKSDSIFAKLEHGWWLGTIVGVQTGAPFTVYLNTNRDQSGEDGATGGIDRPDVVTSANIAAITAQAQAQCKSPSPGSACSYTPVIFNKNTVITGNPNSWYNANMFALPAVGVPGDEGRNMLTGPGIATWDMSLNKNTALPFLGEAGQLQFRTEVFNLLNHPNFGQPPLTPFPGTITDQQEAPSVTPISTTTTDPREIQFSLKVLF